MIKLITLGLVCLMLGVAGAGDWYVATNGTGAGTGWADATNNLQGAITACASNFTVWVSNGVYNPANLSVGGGVTVRSKTGIPTDVILDGNAVGRVATMAASSWLVGCTVSNGADSYAGGIFQGNISNCMIINNAASPSWGGGIGNAVFVYNCLVANNSAVGGGGGIYNVPYVYNSTISGNSADGTLFCGLYNCVSWGNAANDYTHNAYDFWEYSVVVGENTINGYGVGSITNDPLFVSSSDFHLQVGSPCINTGSNGLWTVGARDLDGNKRIWPYGGTVDMGAYEYGSEAEYSFPSRIRANSIHAVRGANINAIRGRAEGAND